MKKTIGTMGLVATMIVSSLAVGCSDEGAGALSNDRNDDNSSLAAERGATSTSTQSAALTINGHVDASGLLAATASVGIGAKGEKAAEVRVSSMSSLGVSAPLAQASVDANGSYSLALSKRVEAGLLLVEAVDKAGQVVGSSVVVVDAEASIHGAVAFAMPISTTTSIQAKALVALVRAGLLSHDALMQAALNLRTFVDADVTASVTAAVDAGVDVDAAITAVANAALVAGRAQATALAKADASASIGLVTRAQIGASAKLSASLDATVSNAADPVAAGKAQLLANLEFSRTVDATLSASITAEVSADVRASAALGFGAAFEGGLDYAIHAHGDALLQAKIEKAIFAAVKASAKASAQCTTEAAVTLVAGGGADVSAIAKVEAAGLQLTRGLEAAASYEEILKARGGFVTSIGATSALGQASFTQSVAAMVGVRASIDATDGLCLNLGYQARFEMKRSIEALAKASAQLDGVGISASVEAKADAAVSAMVGAYLQIGIGCKAGGPFGPLD